MKTIKFIPKKKYILAFMISGLFYFSSYAQDISDSCLLYTSPSPRD